MAQIYKLIIDIMILADSLIISMKAKILLAKYLGCISILGGNKIYNLFF